MQKKISTLFGIVIIIVVAVIFIGGVFVYQYLAIKNQPIVQAPQNKTNQIAGWETYTNAKYGFEVKYPSDWKITDTSTIVAVNNIKNTAVNIESPLRYDLPGYLGVPTSYRILIYLDGSSQIASVADFGSPQLSHQSEWNVNIDKKTKEATNEYRIGQQIISTFKLITLSTKPSITSVSPNTAKIGQLVTVIGTNLNGFEGDKNLWIENSAGQKGVIYANDRSGPNTIIKFTLAGSYCTIDNSYSGLPCPSYITITPGTYNIYAQPWSDMSNKVLFSVSPATCTPNWQCAWGPCTNGYQSQIAKDSNNCGLSSSGANIACPALAKVCAQPSIAVVSPNGGENYVLGQTVPIKFSLTGLPAGQTPGVTLQLYSGIIGTTGAKLVQTIASDWTSDAPYQWLISNKLLPGQYSIYASTSVAGSNLSEVGISDSSDGVFTVFSSSTDIPYISILSPTGDTWYPWSSYKVSWVAPSSVSTVNLAMYTVGSSRSLFFAWGVPASQGYYITTTGPRPGIGSYVLEIEGRDAKNNLVADSKSNFIIEDALPQPSINVFSPDGGETLTQGQQTSISWVEQDLSDISVFLVSANSSNNAPNILGEIGSVSSSYSNTSWDGKTVWADIKDPSSSKIISPGKYKIYLVGNIPNFPGQTVNNMSDNYFTVVAP